MKSKLHIIKFILESAKAYQALFVGSVLLVFSYKGLSVILPFVMGNIIDHISGGITETAIYLYLFSFVAFLLIILTPVQDYVMSKFVQKVMLRSSLQWVEEIYKKDLSFFSSYNVGNLVNSIDRGVAAHEQLLFHINGHLLPVLIEFVVVFSILIWLGAWSLVLGIVLLMFIQYGLTNKLIYIRRLQVESVNDAEDEMAGEMTELLSNGLVFKLEQRESVALKRLSAPLNQYADESVKLAVSSALMDALKFLVSNIITLGTIAYGIWAVGNKMITVGELVTLLTVVARVSGAFNDFLKSKKVFDQFDVDVDDLIRVLSYGRFDREGRKISKVDELCVEKFKSDRFKIAKEIKIERGEKIAIVGPTGQGKSTLIEILGGMTEEARKVVKVNGTKLEEVDSKSHLSALRYCPQDHYLISGSVAENVGEGQENVMKRLGLSEEIVLGQKELGERAINISGGEAKRLSLTRALREKGEVMIFDEPTSALNQNVAHTVWNELFEQCKDSTLVTTTHDYSELDRFDRIMVVKNGCIVIDGSCYDVKQSWEFKSLVG